MKSFIVESSMISVLFCGYCPAGRGACLENKWAIKCFGGSSPSVSVRLDGDYGVMVSIFGCEPEGTGS